MKGFEGISDEKAAKIDEAVKSDYSWITAPYAPYELSNNNAEINRLKSVLKVWNAVRKRVLSAGSLRAAKRLPTQRKIVYSFFLTKSPAKNSAVNSKAGVFAGRPRIRRGRGS